MPKLWMLIGVPGSGKSTWISRQNFDKKTTVIVSTDNIIDQIAKDQNKTYNEVFKNEIKGATAEMNRILDLAVKNKFDIVWDQTNTTKKARASKLSRVTDDYEKIAVFFRTPPRDVLQKRLASRPGKNIPHNVMQSMISMLEYPEFAEGFDSIIEI